MPFFTDMTKAADHADRMAKKEEELLQGLADLSDEKFEMWVKLATHHSPKVIEAFRRDRADRRST